MHSVPPDGLNSHTTAAVSRALSDIVLLMKGQWIFCSPPILLFQQQFPSARCLMGLHCGIPPFCSLPAVTHLSSLCTVHVVSWSSSSASPTSWHFFSSLSIICHWHAVSAKKPFAKWRPVSLHGLCLTYHPEWSPLDIICFWIPGFGAQEVAQSVSTTLRSFRTWVCICSTHILAEHGHNPSFVEAETGWSLELTSQPASLARLAS